MATQLPDLTPPFRPRLWFPVSPRPHFPPPAQPLRIKVSYTKTVTVCIAAIAQAKNGSRIVLCCDSRLDQGVFGSSNYAPKLNFVGTNWLAMISGRWKPAQELVKFIKSHFQNSISRTSDAMLAAVDAAKDFRASAFFSKQATEEAIITGFAGGDPIVLHVSGNMSVESLPYGSIGEGSYIASMMMNQRDYSQNRPVEQVAYIVYEAKRCSEKVGSVGKDTTLVIQSPRDGKEPPNTVNMDWFDHPGLARMDAMYKKYWLQRINTISKRFPKGWFVNPKAL